MHRAVSFILQDADAAPAGSQPSLWVRPFRHEPYLRDSHHMRLHHTRLEAYSSPRYGRATLIATAMLSWQARDLYSSCGLSTGFERSKPRGNSERGLSCHPCATEADRWCRNLGEALQALLRRGMIQGFFTRYKVVVGSILTRIVFGHLGHYCTSVHSLPKFQGFGSMSQEYGDAERPKGATEQQGGEREEGGPMECDCTLQRPYYILLHSPKFR